MMSAKPSRFSMIAFVGSNGLGAIALSFALLLPASANAITGGTPSYDQNFRPVVSYLVTTENGQGNWCSGTFISPRFMVTAAHCFDRITAKNAFRNLKLALFPSNVNLLIDAQGSPHSTAPNVKLFRFMGKKSSYMRTPDIAVVEFPQYQPNGWMPRSMKRLTSGDQVVLGGYGCDRSTGAKNTDFKIAEKTVLSAEGLIVSLEKSETGSACPGDSGGPILVRDERGKLALAGVMSYLNPVGSLFSNANERLVRIDSETDDRIDLWIAAVLDGEILPEDITFVARASRAAR